MIFLLLFLDQKILLSTLLFLLLELFLFFFIPELLPAKQPLPQILSILETISHSFTIQHHYNKPPTAEFNTTG